MNGTIAIGILILIVLKGRHIGTYLKPKKNVIHVRNNCVICLRSMTKIEIPPNHQCYFNWTKVSTRLA